MKYLEGYLSAIPEFEKKNIINELNKLFQKDDKDNTFNLNKPYNIQSSDSTIDFGKKPSDTYNSVFSSVDADVQVFNSIINSLSNNINALDELIEALIEEINLDISNTQNIIDNIQLKFTYNQELVKDTFINEQNIETQNLSTRYLYQDRDETFLNKCSYDNELTLQEIKNEDLLHKPNGKTAAKIILNDYRGPLNETDHVIEKAIDNNQYTYWEASAFMMEPLDMPFNSIDEKGHFLEIKIILPKYTNISELVFSHTSAFPLTIYSIMVGGANILSKPVIVDESYKFPLINKIDGKITIVINQPNYILKTIVSNEKEKEIDELWNKAYDVKDYSMANRKTFDYYYNKYKNTIKTFILKWKAGIIRG